MGLNCETFELKKILSEVIILLFLKGFFSVWKWHMNLIILFVLETDLSRFEDEEPKHLGCRIWIVSLWLMVLSAV